MNELHTKRCFHHPRREAVARCPECSRFYCRECIADHESRALCADCINRLLADRRGGLRDGRRFGLILRALAALFVAWFMFYGIGRVLLRLPATFHDGEIWSAEGQGMSP